jgi:hypothetical protein
MKRNIHLWQLMGFAVVSLGGTLLHFLYDWTGQSVLAAPFSGVNESPWEHMKLFFFPALFCYIALCLFKRNHEPCILHAFPKTIFLGTFLIPALFYTYSGILGFHVSFLDISTFYVSVFFSFFYLYKSTVSVKKLQYSPMANVALLFLAFLFISFTYNPPDLGIFKIP